MLYLITESKRLLSRGNSVMRIWVADRLHVFPLNGETAKVYFYIKEIIIICDSDSIKLE
uniref:Uncharacterized protein n=1 Tax=Heterorhabditis bacteriophora TaxID=37862 RepID=A0A1I7X015_HETBA